jgi:DNA-binding NtrC family response regulator
LISTAVYEELGMNGPYVVMTAHHLDMDDICAVPADGMVFIKDFSQLPRNTQVAFLRRLDRSELEESHGEGTLPALILGCGPELAHEVCTGTFLPELYFSLSRCEFHIPSLRERSGDIPVLIKEFAGAAARERNLPAPRIDVAFIDRFSRYSFPGNVAELKMLVYKAVHWAEGERLSADVAQETMSNHSVEPIADRLLKNDRDALSRIHFPARLPTITEARKQLIMEALRRSGGNQSAAARILGLTAPAISKFLSQTD